MSIIVKLNGGLGNQLFQYAFARGVSSRLKTDFKLDLTAFGRYYTHDPYLLHRFDISPAIAGDLDMCGFVWLRKHHAFFESLYSRIRSSGMDLPWYCRERGFRFDPGVFSRKGATYFDGFWQSEEYFKHIGDEIREELKLKEPLSEHGREIDASIGTTQAVSLHMRHYPVEDGALAWHGICSTEYYRQALELVAKRVADPHLFVFSDNYPWVRKHLVPIIESRGLPYTLVENDDSKNGEDMILMSHCKHHIIANSSFSWWGAWLNPSADKLVIAPQKWFANAPKNDTTDLIPKEWVRI